MPVDRAAPADERAAAPGSADAPPPLRLAGIARSFGATEALAGVDLELRGGTLVRIKGPNGAGKTTLLRIASGLLRPDRGTASVRGLDPEHDRSDYLARVGFLTAGDRGLYARLSPVGHLRLCADLALLRYERREAAIERAVADFDIAAFADRRVDRLSLGQRQRTRLAIAFLHEPDVILLDEPANSLDDQGLSVLDQALARLRERSGAALWCAPATVDAPMPFDERYVLDGGRLHRE
jgi:ABC-type multidrug transport system ATPase subunit